MRSIALGVGVMVALGLMAVSAGEALADSPGVLQAVVINTNGKDDALLAEAKKNEKIFKRLGIQARRRYLQATLAGSQTGTMIVSIDYPSLTAFAEAQAKLAEDKEWQEYISRITGAGMTVESNSIYRDLTP